jgi:hypothetical protein
LFTLNKKREREKGTETVHTLWQLHLYSEKHIKCRNVLLPLSSRRKPCCCAVSTRRIHHQLTDADWLTIKFHSEMYRDGRKYLEPIAIGSYIQYLISYCTVQPCFPIALIDIILFGKVLCPLNFRSEAPGIFMPCSQSEVLYTTVYLPYATCVCI